jgi:hypothetical protein
MEQRLTLVCTSNVVGLLAMVSDTPRLAVVIPTTTSNADVTRLAAGLVQWNDPGFTPCRAMGVAAPSLAQLQAACGFAPGPLAPPLPRLVFFSNIALTTSARQRIELSLAAAQQCFVGAEFLAANLTAVEDTYPRGASLMFYALFDNLAGTVDYFAYLEPDTVPLRAHWAEALAALLPPRTERFWVKGSQVRGPVPIDEWVTHHANGNALYAASDTAFAAAVRGARARPPRLHEGLEPYDLAIAAAFYDPVCHAHGDGAKRCMPTTPVAWRRAHLHLYKYSDFIVNHHNAVLSVAAARATYPCSILVHGNRTLDFKSRPGGRVPRAFVKATDRRRHRAATGPCMFGFSAWTGAAIGAAATVYGCSRRSRIQLIEDRWP